MNETTAQNLSEGMSKSLIAWLLGIPLATALWFVVYGQLDHFANLVLSLVGLDRSSALGESVHFFFYDAPKVMLLLVGVVFFMGIVQTFFFARAHAQPARRQASRRRQYAGGDVGYRHAILLLFSGATVYRLRVCRCAAGRHLFFFDCGADGQ